MRIKMAAFYLVCLAGWLLGTPASAQTVVNATGIEFDDANYATTTIDNYVIEIWTPGSDTTTTQPLQVTANIPKVQATQVTGQPATRRTILVSNWGITIPKGPTFVASIKSVGPSGSARSAVSNPFTFPLPIPPPTAVTGVTMVAK